MRIVHLILLLLLICVIAIFCVQNLETTTVQFLQWSITVPMPLLAFLIYLLGMFSGGAVFSFIRRSLHGVTKENKQKAR